MSVHVLNTPWQAVAPKRNSKHLSELFIDERRCVASCDCRRLNFEGVLRRGHSSSFMNESASATAVASIFETHFVKFFFFHYCMRSVVPPIRAVHGRTLFAWLNSTWNTQWLSLKNTLRIFGTNMLHEYALSHAYVCVLWLLVMRHIVDLDVFAWNVGMCRGRL